MNSFYISGTGTVGSVVSLPEEEARHACQVMRLEPGEEIYAVDEAGSRFLAVLQTAGRSGCEVLLKERLSDNEAPVSVTVYEGLPKGDKLDTVTQKCTELGACRIVPLKLERCVVKLDAKNGEKRRERLDRIAREAGKQCKRGKSPEILAPVTLKEAEKALRAHDLLLIPWEDAGNTRIKDVYAQLPDAKDIGIVIGPEGGISAAEAERLVQMGGHTVTLGPRILRTETAAVVSCALVMQLWGDI